VKPASLITIASAWVRISNVQLQQMLEFLGNVAKLFATLKRGLGALILGTGRNNW
jgi:hypothetical protein